MTDAPSSPAPSPQSLDASPRLALPLLLPGQAGRAAALNEALLRLDAAVSARAQSRTRTAPPDDPQPGQAWLVPDGSSGAWASMAPGTLAVWQDGAWEGLALPDGARITLADEGGAALVREGGAWRSADERLASGGLARLGVNAAATGPNRLSVASEAVLLSHDPAPAPGGSGSGSGSGDVRLSLNRRDASSVAGLLLQTGYGAEAELALQANGDGVALKTGAAGGPLAPALLAGADGAMTFPRTRAPRCTRHVMSGTGSFAPDPQSGWLDVLLLGGGGGGAGGEMPGGLAAMLCGGGGGAGAWMRIGLDPAALGGPLAYGVGTGGAGGFGPANAPVPAFSGGDGGESWLKAEAGAARWSAGGGGGAAAIAPAADLAEFIGGAGGMPGMSGAAAGFAALTGDPWQSGGQSGGSGFLLNGGFHLLGNGAGAGSPFGEGGPFRVRSGPAATGYGAGGAGAGFLPSRAARYGGGAGAPGLVVICEWRL